MVNHRLLIITIVFTGVGVLSILSAKTYVEANSTGEIFTVNSEVDIVDAIPGDGMCEAVPGNSICTLRAAIQETNILPGTDIIILPAGTYKIAIVNNDYANSGSFDIRDDLFVIGEGKGKSIIDGGKLDKVINIWETAFVNISDVTITNGRGEIFGGGIQNKGILKLERGEIVHNTVYDVLTIGAAGGGILNEGIAEIVDTTVMSNSTEGFGSFAGGILNFYGSITITNSTIAYNTTDSSVGGGGGIYNDNGSMTIVNSTITHNAPQGNGGGIYNRGSSSINIVNSTIYNNERGGIYNDSGEIKIKNSIIAENVAEDCTGSIGSEGHNLTSDNSCNLTSTGDITNTIPQLSPLQSNEGATPTHALLNDSPAIDAGDDTGCPIVDQRGMIRPLDGNDDDIIACDIGAFEYNLFAKIALVDDTTPAYYNTALGTTLDGTQPQFPRANLADGDPIILPASEPNLTSATSILGDWLSSKPFPLNGHWSILQSIPKTWLANTETAIIYPINAGLGGITNLTGNFGVDNGIFVWVNGEFKFGALAPAFATAFEYSNIDLGSLPPGQNYIQILREDHGGLTGYSIKILGVVQDPPTFEVNMHLPIVLKN